MARNKKVPAPEPDPTEKWETQLRKGCLELAILGSLWAGKQYGLEILRRLERESELVVSEGTVYPLLARLKADGLLESEWVETDGGHPRKYYRLTPTGRRRASQMARLWTRFAASVGDMLSPILKEAR
ncbi:MAG: PadR family transcriptional regulator [Gemmatimonadales bacterium]